MSLGRNNTNKTIQLTSHVLIEVGIMNEKRWNGNGMWYDMRKMYNMWYVYVIYHITWYSWYIISYGVTCDMMFMIYHIISCDMWYDIHDTSYHIMWCVIWYEDWVREWLGAWIKWIGSYHTIFMIYHIIPHEIYHLIWYINNSLFFLVLVLIYNIIYKVPGCGWLGISGVASWKGETHRRSCV